MDNKKEIISRIKELESLVSMDQFVPPMYQHWSDFSKSELESLYHNASQKYINHCNLVKANKEEGEKRDLQQALKNIPTNIEIMINDETTSLNLAIKDILTLGDQRIAELFNYDTVEFLNLLMIVAKNNNQNKICINTIDSIKSFFKIMIDGNTKRLINACAKYMLKHAQEIYLGNFYLCAKIIANRANMTNSNNNNNNIWDVNYHFNKLVDIINELGDVMNERDKKNINNKIIWLTLYAHAHFLKHNN